MIQKWLKGFTPHSLNNPHRASAPINAKSTMRPLLRVFPLAAATILGTGTTFAKDSFSALRTTFVNGKKATRPWCRMLILPMLVR